MGFLKFLSGIRDPGILVMGTFLARYCECDAQSPDIAGARDDRQLIAFEPPVVACPLNRASSSSSVSSTSIRRFSRVSPVL